MRYLPPATAIAGEGRYPGEPGAEEGTAAALNMEDILYVLRKRRNDAVHAGLDSRHNSIAVPGRNVRCGVSQSLHFLIYALSFSFSVPCDRGQRAGVWKRVQETEPLDRATGMVCVLHRVWKRV